jgi:hypothetical protein
MIVLRCDFFVTMGMRENCLRIAFAYMQRRLSTGIRVDFLFWTRHYCPHFKTSRRVRAEMGFVQGLGIQMIRSCLSLKQQR